MNSPNPPLAIETPLRDAVLAALAEDRAGEDATTRGLGEVANRRAETRFISEETMVVAGLPVIASTFHQLDASATIELLVREGDRVEPGTVLAVVRGTAGALLAGERVALNFLQRLSGIASATRRIVDQIAGTGARVTHTRKTTPGLRDLERYAVVVGGGVLNRASLADQVLWKDNHWRLLGDPAGLGAALERGGRGTPVVVEVENEAQLAAALAVGVTHLLVDNQSPARLRDWVRRAGPGVTIQASGGITEDNARAYAEAGAQLLAIGAITHSVRAAAIRCDISSS